MDKPLNWSELGPHFASEDRARELLETTSQPVEHIGRFTGLGAPAGVRAAFHRHLGTSPQEYRTLFRHRTTAANS